jgi:iron complex transport system substrate-binding protein
MKSVKNVHLVSVSVVTILLAACVAPPPARPKANTPATAIAPAMSGFPVTIESCGRKLTFAKPPERVVTAYQPALEILVSLGVGNKIVGGLPFDEGAEFLPGQKEIYDKVPKISDSISMPAKEKVLSLNPDFVFTVNQSELNAERGRASIEDLAAIGANAYVMAWDCPGRSRADATLEDSYTDILNMGKVFGVSDKATALVEGMTKETTDIQARVKKAMADKLPARVLGVDVAENVLYTIGRGLNGDLFEIAGGKSVFADEKEEYFAANMERVVQSNPDIYVIYDYLPGPTIDDKLAFVYKNLPDAPATKNKRYIVVPAVEMHPGVRNVELAKRLAMALYPEAFK